MSNAILFILTRKLAVLCLATLLVAACAKEPVPIAYQGLNDQQTTTILSDTTTLYQTKHEMSFEYLGPKGEYRRWASNGGIYILSGTWSVSDGSVCRHIYHKSQNRTHTYCEKNAKKFAKIAAVFTGDALKMLGRKHAFCKIEYRTVPYADGVRPDPESTVYAISGASSLRHEDDEETSRLSCESYVLENRNNWYLDDQKDIKTLLSEVRQIDEGGQYFDMHKFEIFAPDYLTPEGIVVFRRYSLISNSLTRKSKRANKSLLDP